MCISKTMYCPHVVTLWYVRQGMGYIGEGKLEEGGAGEGGKGGGLL